MPETFQETVEFKVKSPKAPLTGLDMAEQKLIAIENRLNRINAILSKPIEFRAPFRGTQSVAAARRRLFPATNELGVEALAKGFGYDPEEFRKFVATNEQKILSEVNKSRSRMIKKLTGTGGQAFVGTAAADVAIKQFSQAEAKRTRLNIQDLLKNAGNVAPVAAPAQAAPDFPAAPSAGGSAPKRPAQSSAAPRVPAAGGKGGAELETILTEPADARRPRSLTRRTLDAAGRQIDATFREINGEFEKIKDVIRDPKVKQARDTFSQQVRDIRAELTGLETQRLAGATAAAKTGRPDFETPRRLVEIRRRQAANLTQFVGDNEGRLRSLGLGNVVDRARQEALTLQRQAQQLELRTEKQRAAHFMRLQKNHERWLAQQQKVQEQREKEARARREQQIDERQRLAKARLTSEAGKEQAQSQVAATERARAERNRQIAEAERQLQQAVAAGGRITSNRIRLVGGKPVERNVVVRSESEGRITDSTFKFNEAGAEVRTLNRELKDTRKEAGLVGREFVRNTAQVTAWAASVAALYGTLGLLRFGVNSLANVQAQAARLDQVFRKVGGTTEQLIDDTLRLASANGRDADEALEASIQWSRLGLTRAQVNVAVATSLQAANVAEISAAEATEKLAAVTRAYNLEVSQLPSVLGQLNAVSNTYNVTNKDMLEGIARTAGVARQAGVELSELIGLIGATVGATGQTGPNIGNAIKRIIARLSQPTRQATLQDQFDIDIKDQNGDLKAMGDILADLFVKFQALNRAQRQDLLFKVAGSHQISRLSAILDNYIKAQTLAISAQLNLNSAQEENLKILNTMRSQTRGLVSEFERFITIQGTRGPAQAMTESLEFFRNLLGLANTGPGSAAVTGLLALLGALGAKLAVTAVQMQSVNKQGGFLANTAARFGALFSTVGGATNALIAGHLAAQPGAGGIVGGINRTAGDRLGRGRLQFALGAEIPAQATGMSRASRLMQRSFGRANVALGRTLKLLAAALVSARALIGALAVPAAVIAGGMIAFNKVMHELGLSIDQTMKKMAGFNQEAQEAAAAANAFNQASRLFETTGEALESTQSASERLRLVKQVAEVEVLSARQREELLEAARKDDQAATQAALERAAAEAKFNEQQKRAEEIRARRRQIENLDTKINELERQQETGLTRGFFSERRESQLQQLRQARATAEEEQVQLVVQSNQALQDTNQLSARQSDFLERQKTALEAIAELTRTLPSLTREDQLNAELQALEAQKRVVKVSLDELRSQQNAAATDESSQFSARQSIQKAIQEEQLRLADVSQALSRVQIDTPFDQVGQRSADLIRERNAIEANIRDLQGRLQQGAAGPSASEFEITQLIASRGERLREIQQQIQNAEATRAIVRRQDEVSAIQRRVRNEQGTLDVGRNDTERLLNRQAGLLRRIQESRQRLNQGELRGLELRTEQVRLFENEMALLRTRQEMDQQRFDLLRQENQLIKDNTREFQQAILAGGPGDLLKELGAFRATQSGLSPGQFLALSPDARQRVQRGFGAGFPGRFNPELQSIRRAQDQLGPPGPVSREVQQAQIQIAELRALRQDIFGGLQAQLDPSVRAIANFTGEVSRATTALSQIPAIVKQLAAAGRTGGSALPQSGGVGGSGLPQVSRPVSG